MTNFTFKKIFGLIVSVVLIAQNALAQPPNDVCSGALATNADGTCYGPGLPQTTTVGAGDNWIGTVGCAGNNNEVWFSFVATTSQLNVNITSGTIGGNLEFILVQSLSPPCGGITLGGGGGSLCGASPLTGTFNGLQIGGTYYYTISSTGSAGTFTSCLTSVVPAPVSGQDCPAAAILCTGATFTQGTSAAGYGTQEISTSNSCWGSGGERQSKWFKFTIGCSGTLEFNILPNTLSNDYDWALFNITGDPAGCTTKGNSIACNWSGCKGSTGITTCPNAVGEPGRTTSGAGCGGGPAAWNVTTLNVTAGNTYALLVDNFSTSNAGFSLTFGGACGGGTAVIGPDARFTGSLDASCYLFTGVKLCPTANSTYLWNYGDGSTSTGANGSHVYTTDGAYTVTYSVTDALGCVTTTSQTLNVGCILPIELSEFNAVAVDNERVDIDWTTVSEDNNDFFTVEKSKDGETFEEVGTIDGAGTTQSTQLYAFIDRSPYSGVSYYRLKQTDFDGKFSYSDVETVMMETAFSDLSIYPNPVKGNSKVIFELGASGQVNMVVSDLSGKSLIASEHKAVLGLNTIDVNTSQLTAGMYLLTVNNATESKTIRFVVK